MVVSISYPKMNNRPVHIHLGNNERTNMCFISFEYIIIFDYKQILYCIDKNQDGFVELNKAQKSLNIIYNLHRHHSIVSSHCSLFCIDDKSRIVVHITM